MAQELQERPWIVLGQNTRIQWPSIAVGCNADSLLKPWSNPWRKTVFDLYLHLSYLLLPKELASGHITTKFIYSKVNMTVSSYPSVIPFPSDFSLSFCSFSPKNPHKQSSRSTARRQEAQQSPRMTPRLHATSTCPCGPSKVGDIKAGTSPKSSLIILTDFNVLQNHVKDLPNYQPDNGEWSRVPGILQPASPSHACSCLASGADCSMWRPPPHTSSLPSPPSSLPAPITTAHSMWILWMKLSDSYETGRGLFSKLGNVWTSGFIRDFSQSADSSLT